MPGSATVMRQPDSRFQCIQNWHLLACTPHIWKSGGYKNFFSARSARESCFVPLTFRIVAPPLVFTVYFFSQLQLKILACSVRQRWTLFQIWPVWATEFTHSYSYAFLLLLHNILNVDVQDQQSSNISIITFCFQPSRLIHPTDNTKPSSPLPSSSSSSSSS